MYTITSRCGEYLFLRVRLIQAKYRLNKTSDKHVLHCYLHSNYNKADLYCYILCSIETKTPTLFKKNKDIKAIVEKVIKFNIYS